MARLIVGGGEAELLEVVGALDAPGRLAADCTAGSSSAISTAMMAMTTRSSISVKARPWAGDSRVSGSSRGLLRA